VRRVLPTTLTARLVTTAVALVAVVTVLIGFLATAAIRSYLSGQLDEDLLRTSERAAGALEQGLPLPAEPPQDGRPPDGGRPDGDRGGRGDSFGFGQRIGTLSAYLSDDERYGFVISAGDRTAEWSVLDAGALRTLEQMDGDDEAQTVHLQGLGNYRVRVDEVDGATLVSGLPTEDVDDTIGTLIAYEVALALLGVVVAGAVGWLVVRRQLRPLREVATTAHEVAALPLSEGEIGVTARVPDRLTDEQTEVGQVGAALNTLLGEVERALDDRHRSEQQVRRFVADASHELRTPLAVISGYAELSRRDMAPEPERLLQNMEKVRAEAARMSRLVDDLLLLARLDAGRPLDRDEVDLTRLVLESVADSQVVAPGHHWLLDLPDEPVGVTGDAERLHQVISNLLSNARRHTPPGTRVTARVRRASDGAVLTVEDDGPGIPTTLQGQVFERFARGDTARTRAVGGTGLGLSLVKAIVDAHRGGITVDSRPGLTRIEVALPS
jgi:two-component system, OmpR family, sensor kinase